VPRQGSIVLAVNVFWLMGFTPAFAQAPVPSEVAATYVNAFVSGDYVDRHSQGWTGSIGFPVTPRTEIVAEVKGDYHSDRFNEVATGSTTMYLALAGPKLSRAQGKIRPYFKFVAGVGRSSSTSVVGSMKYSFIGFGVLSVLGGGVDVILSRHFGLRMEGETIMLPWHPVASIAYPNVRLGTGLTYRR